MSKKEIQFPHDRGTTAILDLIRDKELLPVKGATKIIRAQTTHWDAHCKGYSATGAGITIGRRLTRMRKALLIHKNQYQHTRAITTMSDGINTSVPLVIEFSEDKASIYYGHKEGKKVSQLIKALGMPATEPKLVCHSCGRKFQSRRDFNAHTCE